MPPPPRRWIDMDDAKREQAKRDTGKRVRRMRESLGLTVSELAERAGVPRQYIYDLEGGVRVSITNIVAAALGLGLSADYLLGIIGSSDTAQHNITHDCCLTAARLDAAGRAPGTVLVRAADGPMHPYTGIERGGDVMRRAFGEDVKLLRCGEYEWKGERWRVRVSARDAVEEEVMAAVGTKSDPEKGS